MSSKQVRKSLALPQKFQNVLLRTFKLFVRPCHDNGQIIYDDIYHFAFHQKVDALQCNASLVIKGPIRGISKKKLTGDGTGTFDVLLSFTIVNLQTDSLN